MVHGVDQYIDPYKEHTIHQPLTLSVLGHMAAIVLRSFSGILLGLNPTL
jgi:hypothetical protein